MNIYTRPAFQHCGIGRAVVEWLVEQARAWGAGKFYLETSQAGAVCTNSWASLTCPT